jgi:hypothetical protein
MAARELVILPMAAGLAGARLAPMPLREHAFLYVECDVPDGVTLDSWRAAKAASPQRGRLDGLLRRSRARGAHGGRSVGHSVHDSGPTRE